MKEIENKEFRSLYLLHGTETYILDEAVKKIVNGALTEEDMEFNLSQYDLEETPIEVAIDDAETMSFMGDKKVVIVKNPIFLTGQKEKGVEHNLDFFEQYVQSPCPSTIFVIVAPFEKLDKRKKITKALLKSAGVLEAAGFNERNAEMWIREKTNEMNVRITPDAIGRLVQNVGANLQMLESELSKMEMYVGDNGTITEEIVDEMVAKTLEQNIFTLVDKVVNRKIDDALKIFYDLLRQNEEPIKITSLITRQFRIIFQAKILTKQGVPQGELSKRLGLHPYAVKIAVQQSSQFQEDELMDILNKLSDMDYKMKTGTNKKLLLEMFLTDL